MYQYQKEKDNCTLIYRRCIVGQLGKFWSGLDYLYKFHQSLLDLAVRLARSKLLVSIELQQRPFKLPRRKESSACLQAMDASIWNNIYWERCTCSSSGCQGSTWKGRRNFTKSKSSSKGCRKKGFTRKVYCRSPISSNWHWKVGFPEYDIWHCHFRMG